MKLPGSGGRSPGGGAERPAREPWRAVQRDRVHGATELQRRALRTLRPLLRARRPLLTLTERRWLERWSEGIARAQPAMGGLRNLGEEMAALLADGDRPLGRARLRRWTVRKLRALEEERSALLRRVRAAFPPVQRVVTFSRSELVRDLLLLLPTSRLPQETIVLRSLPGGEGARLAGELASLPRARLVEDRDAELWLGSSTLLLLGTDTLFSDGTLLHKVGTRALARLAHRKGARVLALAPSSRCLSTPPPRRARWPPLFDATPGRWIDEVWTDRGPWRPRAEASSRKRPARRS